MLDLVVDCCSMEIDGKKTLTKEDVIGKSKKTNAVMTRCIFITEMLFAGYTTETAATLLKRTEPGIRQLLNTAHGFRLTSNAYRIAEAQCTLLCKNLFESYLSDK